MKKIGKEKDVKPELINSLIKKMKVDSVCLPSFQREFVWKPKQMAMLVESIIRHYPIGTLLFLRYLENTDLGKNSFNNREAYAFQPKYYVIDGQQRLRTFLYTMNVPSSFRPHDSLEGDSKKYKIYLNITVNPNKLPMDIDKPTFVVPRATEEEDRENYKLQGEEKLMPIEYILSEKYIKKWFTKAFDKKAKIHKKYINNIFEVRKRILSYKCPVEYVIRKLNPQDHTNIFRLLNEAGTDLTAFDLLSARVNSYHINLREMWKHSFKKYDVFKQYDLDPIYLLKVLLLIRQTKNGSDNPTCVKKDLQDVQKKYNIDPEPGRKAENSFKKEFKEDWEHACFYTAKALNNLRWDFGACQKKYIPYTPMIVTLAAILWWIDVYKGYDEKYKAGFKEIIKHWYWGSIFARAYDKHSDTIVSDHYFSLREYIQIGKRKKIPSDIKFWLSKGEIRERIGDIDSSGDARYKAILCMPLINGAEDIYSHEYLADSILHDHHIYPKKCVDVKNIEESDLNIIINRMLITDKTNGEIKKQSPYDYLDKKCCKNLDKHFLWKGIYKDKLSYREFVTNRKERLANYLYSLINT